ncbi:MAG TPA: hypothetical protein PL033_19940 [Candidatus Brocadiia bacterium]|nr:hypothetical protein [Candidatus Brocadiia bacterium]
MQYEAICFGLLRRFNYGQTDITKMFSGKMAFQKTSGTRGGSEFGLILIVVVIAVVIFFSMSGSERYLKLVAPARTVYVKIEDKQARTADSIEGLKEATPVGYVQGERYLQFPTIKLVAAEDNLPGPIKSINADIIPYLGGSSANVRISAEVKAEDGSVWTFLANNNVTYGKDPKSAPRIDVTGLDKVAISLQPKAAQGRSIGIALAAVLGELSLSDIRKDGKSLEAEVKVIDADGKTVGKIRKRLDGFGFS